MTIEDWYKSVLTKENMMGPNNLVLFEEAIARFALNDIRGNILDLGCGMGLTTYYLAKEFGVDKIFATDLWILATQMWSNFKSWGVDDKVIPIHSDAMCLPYSDEFFDGIISVDSYHYFGCKEGVFRDKIYSLVKEGGYVLLIMPALKSEMNEIPKLMTEWAGDETEYFHDASWWKKHLEKETSKSVHVIELESGDRAWNSWFSCGHEYGKRDEEFFERGLDRFLTFVAVYIEK